MKTILNKQLVCVFLLFFPISVIFANKINIIGKVFFGTDSTFIAGATVRLLDDRKNIIAGTITNAEGVFSLVKNTRETTNIEISYIGFLPAVIQINGGKEDVDLGNIYLVESNTKINEVVVSGSHHQLNRQLIFPDKLQLKASYDFMSLLQNLSLSGLSVDVLNKKATIHSKPVYWKINGIPRSLEEVKNIKPESILRVDYSEMPSMYELENGYGGTINIILKTKRDGGAISTQLQSALWVGFVNAMINANYHKKKTDFSIDYSSSYRNYPKWQKEGEQFFIGDSVFKRIESPLNSPFKTFDNDLNFTYIYRPNDSKVFSATWRNSLAFQSNDINNNIDKLIHRSSKSVYKGYMPALDLFFQNNLKNGDKLEANIVTTYSMGDNTRDLKDTKNGVELASYSNPVKTNYYSVIGELVYDKPISDKMNLSTGLQNKYINASNEYQSPIYSLDRLHQNNTYVYGQISGRLSQKMQYYFGTGVKLFYVKGEDNSKTYLKNQNSLALFYAPISGLSLSLNSNFTPSLPSLSQLSTIKQVFDNLIIYTGNRDLKPSYTLTNRLNTTYNKGKFNSTLAFNYNYTSSPIFTRVIYQSTEKTFLFKTDNGIYNRQYGAELKVNYRNISDILSLYTTMGLTRYESNVGNNPQSLNSFYWDISALFAYKDVSLAIFHRKNGKTLFNETVLSLANNSGVTLMWNKPRWTLYAQMLYVGYKDGDTYYTENRSKINPYTSLVKIPENGNMLTLGFVWNFDFGKQRKEVYRNLNNYDNNDSVIKVQE